MSLRREEGKQSVEQGVERAIDSLMDRLSSPAFGSLSAPTSPASSAPPPYQSTFFPTSPPPTPPSPAPSLSLLGKLALSNFATPPPPPPPSLPASLRSPPRFDSLSPVPLPTLLSSISPPPVPPLFLRPSTTAPAHSAAHPRPAAHRTPPRLPAFSPPQSPTAPPTQPSPPYSPYPSYAYESSAAFAQRGAEAAGVLDCGWAGEAEAGDEWRIASDADVRRMLDELRDELQHIARKLAAIKRYTARAQQQQPTSGYHHTGARSEESETRGAPLSPRTCHIMQLLEEADELLRYNKPHQPAHHATQALSRSSKQNAAWTADTTHRRPKTAPSRHDTNGATPHSMTSSVSSIASNHLLRAYDELLDRFRSQVLRIDATLAAVD